jgi:TonB family protein
VAAPRTTPLRAPRPVARAARPAPAPTEAPPPPRAEPEPIADLTGVTLTNDGPGVGWSSAVGDGSASAGPIGPPRRTAPAAATGTGTGPSGPPVVALSDLRHRPEPPDLDLALARSYPEDARRAGLTGSATVRATIHPDGTVGAIRGVTASAPTFADACRRTLSGSHWTPPVDRNGRPCATEIRYTCHFELGQ